MRKITINLTPRHRLDLAIVKQRETSKWVKTIREISDEVKSVRTGSKTSRLFRHVFQSDKIRRIVGSNIALVVLATSLIPSRAPNFKESEQNMLVADKIITLTERKIQYPLEKISITQGYKLYHPGIDFDGVTGDAVRPTMAGKVENVQYSRFAYGNAIILNHGSGITTLYAHLSKINVTEGQDVTTSTVIGEVGATGRAFGDHLHFEVRNEETQVNPMSILPPQ